MWRAETRFDPEFQERHFAADFHEFGRSGRVYDRQAIIRAAGAPSGEPIAAKLPLQNLAFKQLATDAVLITYDSEVIYNSVKEFAHRSSVWTRNGSDWVMRFHQGTPFEPKG